MKALVVGYGSIGARHARVLSDLGHATSVVSRRSIDFPRAYSDLRQAVEMDGPDYVVIANPTSEHRRVLAQLAELAFNGVVLVEKPLFESSAELPPHRFRGAYVGYNLRFHPVIEKLKSSLADEKIISVQTYVGQYLPNWRPNTDYSKSYSASAEQGGGVLRDLSHELDYLTWILGGWTRVAALGGRFSALNISSDDCFALLLATPKCPVVSLQVNYLDRLTRRQIIVNTDNHTFEADLVRGTFTCDDKVEALAIDRDVTYRRMHEAVLAGISDQACTFASALDTLGLIDAATAAADRHQWITQ